MSGRKLNDHSFIGKNGNKGSHFQITQGACGPSAAGASGAVPSVGPAKQPPTIIATYGVRIAIISHLSPLLFLIPSGILLVMETESPRSPRYKHTRELVRIALQEDMTQAEIARLCRTTQSVVSDWATGKKKAPENVIKPLLDRYGHRLRRASFRLYLVQLLPEIPWEQTDTGKLVLQLSQDPAGYVRERLSADDLDAWLLPHVLRNWLQDVAAALSYSNIERMRLD